jgi:hypothetical protein
MLVDDFTASDFDNVSSLCELTSCPEVTEGLENSYAYVVLCSESLVPV